MHTKGERRCVCCRTSKQQCEMLRVAKLDGRYVIDHSHKLGGRGAYICKSEQCIKQTIKKHALNRSFKTNVGEEIYQQLGEYEQNK